MKKVENGWFITNEEKAKLDEILNQVYKATFEEAVQ